MTTDQVSTVYARSTTVVDLDLEVAKDFVQDHHRQGLARLGGNPRATGLLTGDGRLVGVAIYCNPRTPSKQREYTTELFRMAFPSGVNVPGGASRLIKHFMRRSDSCDLFTYQDTSGDATDVYKKSGMHLVGPRDPVKTVVVKDGLTFQSATNNRHDWFSIEQVVRYGPDRLLGTQLGELFEGDRRLSNVELFERNGYHLETVPGDRVYEWRNPDIRFYVYKLTSTVDSGYYIGRRRTRLELVSEMVEDGYRGSGGVKFQNWVTKVGVENLRKEILGVYDTWSQVVTAEEEFIGELYKTDMNCKNSKPGGTGLSGFIPSHELKVCNTHGETLHLGDSCKRCSVATSFSKKVCPTHGSSIFQGDRCRRCQAAAVRSTKKCDTHGESLHVGESCSACTVEKTYSLKPCLVHGVTVHAGQTCKKCVVEHTTNIQNCVVHGETSHTGNRCRKCISENTMQSRNCPVHGEVLHQGSSCTLCVGSRSVTTSVCSVHGEVTFRGSKCATCATQKIVNVQVCPVHGESKFVGNTCKKCSNQSLWSDESCPVHGVTRHLKGRCKKCQNAAQWSTRECPVHGSSKHRSGVCVRCSRNKG